MPLGNWIAQTQMAADAVENHFGEQVDLLPWGGQGEFTDMGPDTTRPENRDVRCLYKFRRPQAGMVPEQNSKIAESEAYLSIRQEHIDACSLQAGDRVRLLDPARNGAWMEVVYIAPGPVKRSRVYLIRLKEPPPT